MHAIAQKTSYPKHTNAPKKSQRAKEPKSQRAKLTLAKFTCAFALGMLASNLLNQSLSTKTKPAPSKASNASPQVSPHSLNSFTDILSLTPAQIASQDLATLNLLCAQDLATTKPQSLEQSLHLFDALVAQVAAETQRNWHRWEQNPAQYGNSLAKYKMGMLVTVVQQDFGLRYDTAAIDLDDASFFSDASRVFISGLLSSQKSQRLGSCASMPSLYVAIGQRLGYPMHLVQAKGHLFCRWEDATERVNLEGAGTGLSFPTDSHYISERPKRKIPTSELKSTSIMQSLSPAETIAVFLLNRAACLVEEGRNQEALLATAKALELTPERKLAGIAETLAHGGVIPTEVLVIIGQKTGNQQNQASLSFTNVEEFNRQTRESIQAQERWIREQIQIDPHYFEQNPKQTN